MVQWFACESPGVCGVLNCDFKRIIIPKELKRSALKYFILPLALVLTCCRKETDIRITVFNPYDQQPVKGAKVVINELRQSNFISSGWGKQYDKHAEIGSGYTDDNGVIVFSDESLRRNSKYDYRFVLEESYGVKNTNFDPSLYRDITKGSTNDIVICDYTKGTVDIQFTGLFSPANPGDSLCILPSWPGLFDPVKHDYITGEGLATICLAYNSANTFPANHLITGQPDKACGTVHLTIRKRKKGILSIDTMTVHFPPRKTTTIPITW